MYRVYIDAKRELYILDQPRDEYNKDIYMCTYYMQEYSQNKINLYIFSKFMWYKYTINISQTINYAYISF